ncbi:MAG: hypothetical protein ACRC3H_07215, partial [Lachnospiraceae bacterium]
MTKWILKPRVVCDPIIRLTILIIDDDMGKSEVREIFKNIDEDYLKRVLPKYNDLIRGIHNRMLELYEH